MCYLHPLIVSFINFQADDEDDIKSVQRRLDIFNQDVVFITVADNTSASSGSSSHSFT